MLSRGPVLGHLPAASRRYVVRSLTRLGVTVRQGDGVGRVLDGAVELADGTRLPSDVTVWTASFAVPDLARRSGLPVDSIGRLLVDEQLREIGRQIAARKQSEVQAERVRIARELHDVLAHSLSQINVQAGVGLHLIDSQPQRAAEALANIKSASKAALDEVRTVLGILRSDPGEPAGAPLAPEPDLARLPDLVDSFRVQGLDIAYANALEVESAAPAATQLALYRICQEALTNVLRHSESRGASVYLGVDRASYLLTVTDAGPSRAGTGPVDPGGGLLGMRERAELLHGSLRAVRTETGGFLVEARIPLPRGRAPQAERGAA